MTIKGFSTNHFNQTKSFRIFDNDVISTDILRFINTIPGERPHLPLFGTRIPLLAFKPMDEYTYNIVKEDLNKTIQWYSDRVRMTDFAILEQDNGFTVLVDLVNISNNESFTIKVGV